MDQKPEGTPNPLNPNLEAAPLDANPSEAIEPAGTIEPVDLPISTTKPHTKPPRPTKPSKSARSSSTNGPGRPIDMVKPIDMVTPIKPIDKVEPVKPANPPTPGLIDIAKPTKPIDMVKPTQPVDPSTPVPTSTPEPTPMPTPTPTPTPTPMSVPTPVSDTTTLGVVTDMNGTAIDPNTLDPTNRPMQQAATKQPKPTKKRKRKGLLICMIICLFLAICCSVTAALIIIEGNKPDPVVMAMNRIANGEAPANIMLDGTIDVDVKDQTSPISSVKINVDTEAVASSLINSTIAKFNVNLCNGSSYTAELDELYANNGDLFIKTSKLKDLIKQIATTNVNKTDSNEALSTEVISENQNEPIEISEEIDCVTEEGCPSSPNNKASTIDVSSTETTETTETTDATSTNELINSLTTIFEAFGTVEGEWLRIPVSQLGAILPSSAINNNRAACLAKFFIESNANSNAISNAYQYAPFVKSTNKDLTVDSVKDPIYKVEFSNQNFQVFLSESSRSPAIKNLTTCLGYTDTNDLVAELQNLPDIYVEIDEDYNLTRVYLTDEIKSNDNVIANITADFRISYPTNVNVPEPTNYKEASDIIQQLTQTSSEDQANTPQEAPPEG